MHCIAIYLIQGRRNRDLAKSLIERSNDGFDRWEQRQDELREQAAIRKAVRKDARAMTFAHTAGTSAFPTRMSAGAPTFSIHDFSQALMAVKAVQQQQRQEGKVGGGLDAAAGGVGNDGGGNAASGAIGVVCSVTRWGRLVCLRECADMLGECVVSALTLILICLLLLLLPTATSLPPITTDDGDSGDDGL